jgi:hypothetical protein
MISHTKTALAAATTIVIDAVVITLLEDIQIKAEVSHHFLFSPHTPTPFPLVRPEDVFVCEKSCFGVGLVPGIRKLDVSPISFYSYSTYLLSTTYWIDHQYTVNR